MRIASSLALLALSIAAGAAAQPVQPAGADLLGKRLFLKCASCHALAAGAPAKIGPNLRGIVGRKAGTIPGYAYSPAMKAHDLVWDDAALDRWLERPSALVPGTSMAFAGMAKPEDRKALIAYLKNNGS